MADELNIDSKVKYGGAISRETKEGNYAVAAALIETAPEEFPKEPFYAHLAVAIARGGDEGRKCEPDGEKQPDPVRDMIMQIIGNYKKKAGDAYFPQG